MSEKPPSQKNAEAESNELTRVDMEKGESFEAFADRFIKASTRGEVTGKAYNIEMKLPHLKTPTSVDSTNYLYRDALAILNKQLSAGSEVRRPGPSNEPMRLTATGGEHIRSFAKRFAQLSYSGPVVSTYNNIELTLPAWTEDEKSDFDTSMMERVNTVVKQLEDGYEKAIEKKTE